MVHTAGFESLFQYELVKLKVGTQSTCVYRDYSGGVDVMRFLAWCVSCLVDERQFWRMMCCSRMVGRSVFAFPAQRVLASRSGHSFSQIVAGSKRT